MAQALPAYAIVALLLAASVGPVTRGVRDASLDDFEALDDPRGLDSFPFLKQVRPYLPPLVVEWLIVKKSLNLPPGGDFRVDDDGRVVIVWPDGCEEDYKTYRGASQCDPTPACEKPDADPETCDPCAGLDANDPPGTAPAECGTPPPLECSPGMVAGTDASGDPACVPDPDCELPADHPNRPEDCPAPPPPPRPVCRDGTVQAYDDSCLMIASTLLRSTQFSTVAADRNLPVELKVAYTNLSIVIRTEGITVPDFSVTLTYDTNVQVCWNAAGSGNTCVIQDQGPIGGAGRIVYHDTTPGDLARGNLTLAMDYTPNQTGDSRLQVELYGTPSDGRSTG